VFPEYPTFQDAGGICDMADSGSKKMSEEFEKYFATAILNQSIAFSFLYVPFWFNLS